ncbi:hypothetical protein Har1130_14775 [Haloarcula sp. CBA1130]|uniref:hypothetical protein n=1 Tax=unclassified Haloarcula TaxID=2624677 RepID=UPI001244361D|nr:MULTISPECIES: hypothetical protein [unclassified Haloarcula]KAA9399432.1 hypothetical protein Har1129_14875 [Haloarcula sp. CBA1129]KAA9403947.1 hypothetical protein Har1130_14775 [Haloarcula sp. CBA1130]
MASSRDSAALFDSGDQSGSPSPSPRQTPSTIYQIQIALLRSQVATLETALEREREHRQAVVDRYERLIDGK